MAEKSLGPHTPPRHAELRHYNDPSPVRICNSMLAGTGDLTDDEGNGVSKELKG